MILSNMLQRFWKCMKFMAIMTGNQAKACDCHLAETTGILDKFIVAISKYILFKRKLLACYQGFCCNHFYYGGMQNYLKTQDTHCVKTFAPFLI